jgi:hypothetical protein
MRQGILLAIQAPTLVELVVQDQVVHQLVEGRPLGLRTKVET